MIKLNCFIPLKDVLLSKSINIIETVAYYTHRLKTTKCIEQAMITYGILNTRTARHSVSQSVIVKASGLINTIVAEKMVLDAGKFIKLSGLKRCFFDLVETEVDPNQTMTEMFMFIDVFKKAGIDQSVKIAALYTTGDLHRLQLEEGAKLIDLKLKHFKERNEALKWALPITDQS